MLKFGYSIGNSKLISGQYHREFCIDPTVLQYYMLVYRIGSNFCILIFLITCTNLEVGNCLEVYEI